VQKLEASIDRVGLVQEEFCLWVIPAPWKEDANDQIPPEVYFCYFVCIMAVVGEWYFPKMAVISE
jgi:hypothetical protein